MFYVNPVLREGDFLEGLFLPQTYVATSIRDFEDRRGDVQPTSYWKGALYAATLQVDKLNLVGWAVIYLVNVNYEPVSDGLCARIYDPSQEMSMQILYPHTFHAENERKDIHPGDRVGAAILLYKPDIDGSLLIGLDNTSMRRIPDKEPETSLDLLPAFNF